MRVARAFDRSGDDEQEKLFARLATPVGKYWVCKRTPPQVNEAQECLGGAGYVEEFIMPRLYRQAPLNSIWEGSGNVQCLDVLRAMQRHPETVDAFLAELAEARSDDARLDSFAAELETQLRDPHHLERRARRMVEKMGLALQGALLVTSGNAEVSDAFCASRLAGDGGLAFGTLPADTDFQTIIERAWPAEG